MISLPKRRIRNRDLSARELDIVRLAAKGLANKEIAQQTGLSEKTVKNHFSAIFQKLHISGRTEIVVYAAKHGLLEDDTGERKIVLLASEYHPLECAKCREVMAYARAHDCIVIDA